MNKEFIFPVHVFAEDTDYGGVVYHANYIKFIERARSMFAREVGWKLEELAAKENLFFVVKNITIDYLKPARLHDDLEVVTTIEKVGFSSIIFQQNIRLAKQPQQWLTQAKVVIVCIDKTLKPHELPEGMREKLIRDYLEVKL